MVSKGQRALLRASCREGGREREGELERAAFRQAGKQAQENVL